MDNQQPSNKMEWRTVIEYDHYEVNQIGEIRHKSRKHILTPRANKGGYLYVNFNINGKRTNFAVHRIVANAFIPNPNCYLEVNHKDFNRTNNCIENLEWVSSKENKQHAYTKEENSDARGKAVEQYSLQNELLQTYPSVRKAAEAVNGSVCGISNCCNGRSKTSKGYKWKFVEGSTTKYKRNPGLSVQDSLKKDEDIV